MAEITTKEPVSFYQGETVQWTKELSDYLPTSYTLTYYFSKSDSLYTITATDNGDGTHLATITAADSQLWDNGKWDYQSFVYDNSSIRHFIGEGVIEVKTWVNLHEAGYDNRTFEKKMLDLIESYMYNDGDLKAYQSYSIGGRNITTLTIAELEAERLRYKALVRQQEVKNRRKSNKIRTHFN